MNSETQDLLAKKNSAIKTIKCFSNVTEYLMYLYGSAFIFAFVDTTKSIATFASLVINLAIVLGAASGCDDCLKNMKKTPPNYRSAQVRLGSAISLLLLFALLYYISAVSIYVFVEEDGGLRLALIIMGFASPQLVLGLCGLAVTQNFKILSVQGTSAPFVATPQYQSSPIVDNGGGGINDDIGYNNNGGYAKAPEPFGQPQNQGMAQNPGLNYP